MSSTTADITIKALHAVFATHGLLEELVTDILTKLSHHSTHLPDVHQQKC